MFEIFFSYADMVGDALWQYFGVPALIFMGLYFTIKSGFFQLMNMPKILKIFINMMRKPEATKRGIPALHAFFASIGGCLGIGNVVGVATAVQIGGPGAVFWMWVSAFFGMMVKYAEVYLAIKFRVENSNNSYDGGPMIYLQRAFACKWPAYIFSFLLCMYGVEVYIFRVVSDTLSTHWHLNYHSIVVLLLILVFYIGRGGVSFVGRVSSFLVPLFLMIFSVLSMWVFFQNYTLFPTIFADIVNSAFNGKAAIGAFLGSSISLSLVQGASRACYTGDIGVGYAGVIHSETEVTKPEQQAVLEIFGIFLDTFVVCTMSVMLLLVTGLWNAGIPSNYVVAMALQPYFPYISVVWPLVIFLLGFSSLIAFFVVGRKSAKFISSRYGVIAYDIYALIAFPFFAFFGSEYQSLIFMTTVGGFLLVCNLIGMWRLRKEIKFVLPSSSK